MERERRSGGPDPMFRKGEGPARRIARAPHDRATTYSPAFNSTIGALGLTSVFGMDTGVAPTLWSPGNLLFPKERVFFPAGRGSVQQGRVRYRGAHGAHRQFHLTIYVLLVSTGAERFLEAPRHGCIELYLCLSLTGD